MCLNFEPITLKADMENSEVKEQIIEIPISDGATATEEPVSETTAEPAPVEEQASESSEQAVASPDPLQESDDKFKRLAADFANYKRRAEAERNELLELLEARLLNGILAIYDDFCRLSQHTANVNEQLAQGLKAVQAKWQAWLTNENVELIAPAGEAFDPHLHDALMQQRVTQAETDGKVVLVVENGYKRRDKVLRHAKVIVGHYEVEEQLQETQVEQEPEVSFEEKILETE